MIPVRSDLRPAVVPGEPRIVQPDHWLTETFCPACDCQFLIGDEIVFVVIGASDPDDVGKQQEGGFCTASAVVVHLNDVRNSE